MKYNHPDEDDLTIHIDESDNDIDTGDINTRTLVVEVPSIGSSQAGRQAEFDYHPERETYRLDEYRAVQRSMGDWRGATLKFRQGDVTVLNHLADHIRRTADGAVDVEVFAGD